jgi:hypothetical protein
MVYYGPSHPKLKLKLKHGGWAPPKRPARQSVIRPRNNGRENTGVWAGLIIRTIIHGSRDKIHFHLRAAVLIDGEVGRARSVAGTYVAMYSGPGGLGIIGSTLGRLGNWYLTEAGSKQKQKAAHC